MLKKIFTTKLVIIPILLIIIILLTIGIIVAYNKYMTPLEKAKVMDDANKPSYVIEEVIERDYSDESYVMFALSYLNNNNQKNTFTIYEVRDTINNFFDVNYDLDKLNSIGITPYMVERGVTFDSSSMSYTYNKTYTRTDIISLPIVKYDVEKVRKINNKKYVITYNKYMVTKPYNIYNYYLNKENNQEQLDIITDYLKGNYSYKAKDLINKDNIEDIGSIDGKIEITYVLKDNKLKIAKIEKSK